MEGFICPILTLLRLMTSIDTGMKTSFTNFRNAFESVGDREEG
jgi:hypothetical protein